MSYQTQAIRDALDRLFAAIVLISISQQALAAERPQAKDPIHLSLTFVRSNPVTTIAVGDRTVQAIVDTGGAVEGALVLSREVIDGAGATSLGDTIVSTDSFGRESRRARFRVPVVQIGDQTFLDMTVVQAPDAAGEGPPVPNGIGRQFLSQYFVIVDYASASITLWPPSANTTAGLNCGHTLIPMEHTREAALVVSRFDTQSGPIRLLWDTGATYSMLPETVAEKLKFPTTVRGPNSPKFYQAKMLSAAGHDFAPLEFVLLPLKLPGDFEGMVGWNFFDRHVVCLDYRRREVRIR
jgi:predicted aspartyl protease